jgi:mannitol-1-phosphate/altronate dehydrogenase
MLHFHFGAGRLGLGLVAPFFQKPGSELYLLNRAVSGSNETGATALSPGRRNELLRDHPDKQYFIQKPGGTPADGQVVRYDGFFAYGEDDIDAIVNSIALKSTGRSSGVIVTASILKAENYPPVIKMLNALSRLKQEDGESTGGIYLVACENTLSAREVFEDEQLGTLISPETREHVTCVHALVDRMCVALEEDHSTSHPTVLARAEGYGSLKLELTPESEPLVDLCRGSEIEFGRHIDVEKQLKSWLVNGTHWLIALTVFQEEHDPDLKLNEFLNASPRHWRFATEAMREMSEGVAILLHKDPKYAAFARDVDVDRYLEGACDKFLERVATTDDSMSRILARFRAPTPSATSTIEAFTKRFTERIDAPIHAYEREHGHLPHAASKGLFDLHRLIASGSFIDTVQPRHGEQKGGASSPAGDPRLTPTDFMSPHLQGALR